MITVTPEPVGMDARTRAMRFLCDIGQGDNQPLIDRLADVIEDAEIEAEEAVQVSADVDWLQNRICVLEMQLSIKSAELKRLRAEVREHV